MNIGFSRLSIESCILINQTALVNEYHENMPIGIYAALHREYLILHIAYWKLHIFAYWNLQYRTTKHCDECDQFIIMPLGVCGTCPLEYLILHIFLAILNNQTL